jgi:molybdopterin-synthase adenylyltransferase
LNPHVRVTALRLTADNARAMAGSFDVVADGSDNFATRYAVSDACYYEKRPLVTAAVGAFDGALTVLRPYENGPFGEPNPTYRCLYPAPPPEATVSACSEAGVLGALTGILGAMMALEVIREIVGFGEGLVGRLVLVDALGMRFETLRYRWDPANPLNGTAATAS